MTSTDVPIFTACVAQHLQSKQSSKRNVDTGLCPRLCQPAINQTSNDDKRHSYTNDIVMQAKSLILSHTAATREKFAVNRICSHRPSP